MRELAPGNGSATFNGMSLKLIKMENSMEKIDTVFGIKYSYKHDRKKDVEMYKINFLRILESNFLEEKTLIRLFFYSKSQKILIR